MLLDALVINALLGGGFVLLLLYLDKYEREPLGRIFLLYSLAVLSTSLFGFLKGQVFTDSAPEGFWSAFVEAALLEESFKLGLLAVFMRRWRSSIDEAYDVILYLGVIAAGFSLNENVSYYLNATAPGWRSGVVTGDFGSYGHQLLRIAIFRALPGHVLFAAVGGLLIGRGLEGRRRVAWFFAGLVVAVLLHGLWNLLPALVGVRGWLGYVVVLTLAAAAAVAAAQSRSVYWREQKAWRARFRSSLASIDRRIAEGEVELRRPLQLLLEKVEEFDKRLARLPLLPGTDQRRVFLLLERTFPEPLDLQTEETIDQAGSDLYGTLKEMRSHPSTELDWSYYAFVVLILAVVGGVSGLLAWLLGAAT